MAFTKNVIRILSLAVVAMAYPVEYEQYPQYVPVQYHHPAPLLKHVEVDKYAHPKYTFKYGVKDEHTGDIKEQSEHRDGDVVKGHYSLVEPDGTTRTVKYTSDKHSGFNAEVIKSGHATHPAPVYKKVIAPVVYHHEHIPQEHAAISYGGHEAQYASLDFT